MATLRRSSSPYLLLLSLAVFLLALLPRLGALDRYITPDELRWVDRSLRFAQALSSGDLADTIQSGHPGITTMWLGSTGIRLQHAVPATLPDFDPQNAEVVRFLAPYLDAARLPVILVVAINLVVLFLLLDRLIARRAAFLAAGLIALDPFAIALGSILHVDALLVVFSLNSLAALCVALNRACPTRWLILSGVFAGLAILSKSPGAILGVATLIILAADDLRHRRSILHTIKALIQWSLATALTFILLAPSMWVQPLGTLQLMSSTAEKFSETAHIVNFFNGSFDRDPGALFYPVVMAFRSTPIMWLGLIAGIILIVRAKSEHDQRLRSIAWAYWVFAIVFLGVITLGAKKLDRYVLPALDALYIVSALGLAFVIESIGTRLHADAADKKWKWVLNAVVALLLAVSALQIIPVWPLTLRAFNPLSGGYAAAKMVLPVGGGESAEVGQALQASTAKNIAVSDVIGTAPYYAGGLVATNAAGFAQADALLFTASDLQLTPDVVHAWVRSTSPVMTITVQGQPYAWLYPNRWLNDLQQRLSQFQSGDQVLTDAPTNLPVPSEATQVIDPTLDEARTIALLQQIVQTHDRVWVIHSAVSPRRTLSPISRLLDTYAIQLDQWSSPLGDGALYALPDQLSFTTQPTLLSGGTAFGDRIQLNRAELIRPRGQPGQSIGIVGEWTASGSDAQAVASILDNAGHQWSAGDALVPISDTARPRLVSVPVPLTIPPGEYRLVLNVIDVASGSPINTRHTDGSFGGIDWPLGSITIDPAQIPIDPAQRKPAIMLNADLGVLTAIGTDRPPRPIVSGDPWTLSMEWASTSDRLPALDVQWDLAQNDQVVYSTTIPLNSYSTERWHRGDVLQSKYDFRVPITVPDSTYDLRFKVIDRATGRALNDQAVVLRQVKIASHSRTFTAPNVTHPLDVTFDDLAKLIGADVNRSGTQISVTLYWQAQAITMTNYTALVQLIGADDQVKQQIDNWQIAFDAPTRTWLPGQIIADQYVFAVSSSAGSPETPRFGVGLYDAATGERLPAFENGQRLAQDRVIIP